MLFGINLIERPFESRQVDCLHLFQYHIPLDVEHYSRRIEYTEPRGCRGVLVEQQGIRGQWRIGAKHAIETPDKFRALFALFPPHEHEHGNT